MAQYSIKDVETLSGVKAHTLRVWEQRYNFLKPRRTATNIRYYNDEQLRRILNISVLNKHGWRISRIADLSQEEIGAQVLAISHGNDATDHLLDQLVLAMVDFNEQLFEKTLHQSILGRGVEQTYVELVFPFLLRTGSLWSAGTICPAQEHFISNLLRRKLSAAIDAQVVEKRPGSKRFALFLPEHDTHELLLMFTDYVLRKHHHEVAYIGANMPLSDAPRVLKHFQPDVVVVYIIAPLPHQSFQEYVRELAKAFPRQQLLLGGAQCDLHPLKTPANVKVIRTHRQLLDAIA